VRLVRWDTRNPPGNELPLARYLAERLRALGLEAEVLPITEARGNLLARVRGAGARPGLALCGHLDVVPPGTAPWARDPFGGEVEGGRLHGRGSCDMKGGVAALVAAAAAVAGAGRPLAGDLVIALTAGEEGEALGAGHFVARGALAGCGGLLLAEPTGLEVLAAEKGVLWLEVTARGKAAHGATPHLGVNAVAAVADLLHAARRWSLPHTPHPLLEGPTLNVGTIRGGVKTSMVPDRCTVTLDFRTVPGQNHQDLVARVRAACDRLAAGHPGLAWDLRVINELPPVETPVDAPLVRAAQEAAAAVTGERRPVRGAPYYTDGATLAPAFGLPLVICGPGDPALAHQTDEWAPVGQLVQAADLYARLAWQTLAA
jgi:succinyl-diaminopimelate desuccinylase